MTGRLTARETWAIPTAASVLYAVGLLALLAVSVSLGGGETAPMRWAMTAIPVTLVGTASLVARWSRVHAVDS